MAAQQATLELDSLPFPLTSAAATLDLTADTFGWLESSGDLVGDSAAMRAQLRSDGYLFLPGFLERREVQAAREVIIQRFAETGQLDPEAPVEEAVPADPDRLRVPDLTSGNEPLARLLYGERMLSLFEQLFESAVRHYDFTWMRAMAHGRATRPHADLVFMGRGTDRLLTAWVPLGDIPLEMGGLMVLEGSQRTSKVLAYAQKDVDLYCENQPGEKEYAREVGWRWNGAISEDPQALRAELGGRWLTSPDYRMGDLLVFIPFLVHASLNNRTNRLRFSSDSRYQPADLPADERWIGEHPIAHGPDAKRGVIC